MVSSDASDEDVKYTRADLYNARKEVGGLLLEYLQFYAGSKLNLELTEEGSRFYVEDRQGRDLASIVKEAAAKISPFSINGGHNYTLFVGSRVKIPKHMYVILQLKENILADEKFMAARNAGLANAPVTDEHTAPAQIMEQVPSSEEQTKTAEGIAEAIHWRVEQIRGLQTQAAALGIGPEVDDLLLALNAKQRGR